MNLQEARCYANEQFVELGLNTQTLDEANLPEVNFAEASRSIAVPYVRFGNPDAPYTVVETGPYLTKIDAPHYKLRLQAQQAILGEEFSVVGVQAFEPRLQNLFIGEAKKAAKGDFSPLSERVLRVVDDLNLGSFMLYGYSMGADVSAQTAYDMAVNPNRGIAEVQGLGVIEAARVENRGMKGAIDAMTSSGGDLFENITASRSTALNEAWKIIETSTASQLDKKVTFDAIKYFVVGPLGNLAMIKGFGTSQTEVQLDRVIPIMTAPVLVGKQANSEVTTQAFIDRMTVKHGDQANFHTLTEERDHSGDDRITDSAARLLYFTGLVRS